MLKKEKADPVQRQNGSKTGTVLNYRPINNEL